MQLASGFNRLYAHTDASLQTDQVVWTDVYIFLGANVDWMLNAYKS